MTANWCSGQGRQICHMCSNKGWQMDSDTRPGSAEVKKWHESYCDVEELTFFWGSWILLIWKTVQLSFCLLSHSPWNCKYISAWITNAYRFPHERYCCCCQQIEIRRTQRFLREEWSIMLWWDFFLEALTLIDMIIFVWRRRRIVENKM